LNIGDCLYIDQKFATDLTAAGVTIIKADVFNLFPKFIVIY
jgi:hypothetical protein